LPPRSWGDIYTGLGVRPVINAGGNTTEWGGSWVSPKVQEAMVRANESWISMGELLDKAGERIAELLGTEAAFPTAGCYSAMALAAAACIAGNDAERRRRLPDVSGLKHEIVILKPQMTGFARAYTVCGGKLVEAGSKEGCSVADIEKAIGPNTAGISYYVQEDWPATILPYADTVKLAHKHGLPVIVDGASRNYPLDFFRQTAQTGDLVCFSGKYLNAPQSIGFVTGKKDLVQAAHASGFPFGRSMKVDRQEIVGLVVAVEEWFSMNHEERFMVYNRRFDVIEKAVKGLANVNEAKVVRVTRFPGVTLHVTLNTQRLGKDAQSVVRALDAGNPRVRVLLGGPDTLNVNVHSLADGQAEVVAERLRAVLG